MQKWRMKMMNQQEEESLQGGQIRPKGNYNVRRSLSELKDGRMSSEEPKERLEKSGDDQRISKKSCRPVGVRK